VNLLRNLRPQLPDETKKFEETNVPKLKGALVDTHYLESSKRKSNPFT